MVDQRGFTRIRAANDGDLQWATLGDEFGHAVFVYVIANVYVGDRFVGNLREFFVDGAQDVVKFVHAFAVFGGQAQGFTKT